MNEELPTPNDFAKLMEEDVKRSFGRMNYIDSVTAYAEKHDINIEDMADLINSRLKSKLRLDGENLHFLKKTSKLPI